MFKPATWRFACNPREGVLPNLKKEGYIGPKNETAIERTKNIFYLMDLHRIDHCLSHWHIDYHIHNDRDTATLFKIS